MNPELITKFITPLGLDAVNFKWTPQIVVHQGRALTIQVPEYVPTSRGALPSSAVLAKNNFELFLKEETANAIAQIEAQIEGEKREVEKVRAEFDAKFNLISETKKTKVQWLNRFVARKTIILLSLATLFNMLMCTININHFFGDTFTEIMNQGMSWLCVVLMALLIALSTPYFALLKNQQMVNKTIWILPLDMVVAYIYSHGEMFSTDFIWWFKLVSIGLYTFILGVIIWSIMEVMIGKGITDKKAHYENITSALLVD